MVQLGPKPTRCDEHMPGRQHPYPCSTRRKSRFSLLPPYTGPRTDILPATASIGRDEQLHDATNGIAVSNSPAVIPEVHSVKKYFLTAILINLFPTVPSILRV